MSVQTVAQQAQLPSVNLIPPEIQEAREFKRVQFGLGAVVVLVIVGVGFVYVSGRSGVQDARAALAAAQAKQQAAEKQLHDLQYIKTSASNVAAAEATLTQARSTNVQWSKALDELGSELPANVWYTSVNIVEDTAPGTYPTAASVPTSIGTITFQGYGFTHNDVAAWMDAMGKVGYFADQTFSTSAENMIGDTHVVQFTSTVTVTNGAIDKSCDKQPGEC